MRGESPKPIYTCVITAKNLSDDTKAALAAEIFKIYSSITRAPTPFVHVVFHDVEPYPVRLGSRYKTGNPMNPARTGGAR
jgi:phenylpyruvate tautomerase PptA (4-oxalocrotonate tautomerase family)